MFKSKWLLFVASITALFTTSVFVAQKPKPQITKPTSTQASKPINNNATAPSVAQTTPSVNTKVCPEVEINKTGQLLPYLQTKTHESVWVSWKSLQNKGTVVEFADNKCDVANGNAQSVTGSAKHMTAFNYYNSAQLTNLQANTFYFYRVKTGNKTSGIFRFKTAPQPGTSQKVRFLIFGDHQSALDKRHKKLVEAAKLKIETDFGKPIEEVIDFVVNDGDQVQNGGFAVEWDNLHFKQSAALSGNLPIMTTVGNHEYWFDPHLNRYRAYMKYDKLEYAGIKPAYDETYYAYQYGRNLIVNLNSNVDSHREAKKSQKRQTAWLKKVMAAADKDENIDFITSVMHHPYTTEAKKATSHSMEHVWLDIFAASKKYVMTVSGHHHVYSRGQVIDKPVYHMISGGTGGMLSAQWFTDPYSQFGNGFKIQKTIANWSWQLVEIDPETQTLTVKSYGESHPKLFELKRRMTFNSRLIDSFTRKFGKEAPTRPVLTGISNNEVINLATSRTVSTDYVATDAKLNTTQFQIGTDHHFQNVELNEIAHYEDIFGDTGMPNYTPIDLNKDKNILEYTLAKNSLANGTYYIRVRHRDRNVEWSDWSNYVKFKVVNSSK